MLSYPSRTYFGLAARTRVRTQNCVAPRGSFVTAPSAIVSSMADRKHLAEVKKGVGNWNEWRKQNFGNVPDLSRAKLQGVDLRDADFTEVMLQN